MSLLMLLAAVAFAQDPEFDETVKEMEAVKKPQGEASAEIGGSLVTGNSEFYQLTARLGGGYKWGNNRVSAIADALWGRGFVDLDGSGTLEDAERAGTRVETSRRFNTEARYDRFFAEVNSIYVLAGALIDPFAGYDLRTHEQIGYSRTLIDNDTTNMVIEIGMDYAQENFVEGVDPNYQDVLAVREMFAVKHTFNDNFSIEEIVEAYENVMVIEDIRVNNTFALSAKLSDKISLKASHSLRFDNQPVTGFRPVDQTALVTLVATLVKTKPVPPPAEPPPCPPCAETAAVDEAPPEVEPKTAERVAPEEDDGAKTAERVPVEGATEAVAPEDPGTKTAPREAPPEGDAPE